MYQTFFLKFEFPYYPFVYHRFCATYFTLSSVFMFLLFKIQKGRLRLSDGLYSN
ncbi:hypothetical protein NEISUBOT_04680 [Neisseria subflava NJ9703]|uniref:Uncharacterized protein n=1 Tax=Neisseria subflava NJ9703 TaxID=546268 RepID=A0A9W5IQL7_NEISU|nr:hypothetical protein NEISUBOT_04680 [Neisseria subflava NJ9703]